MGVLNPQIINNPALAALAPQSRVPEVIAGTVVPFIIGTIFVAARFYTRLVLAKNGGLDDLLVLIAWIFGVGITAANLMFIPYGVGRHAFLQTLPDIIHTLQLGYASRILYLIAITTVKISIGVFYLRIFTDRSSRIWIYSITASLGIAGTILLFTVIFQCHPIAGTWNLDPTAKCISNSAGNISNCVVNVVGDLMLIVFIIPRIWPLKMPVKQKIILLCIVSLGILVIVATFVRLQKGLTLNPSSDISWNGFDITTWTSVEINIALFCSCAPTIRPLIRQVLPRLMSSSSGTRRYSSRPNLYGMNTLKSQRIKGNGIELQSETSIREKNTFYSRKKTLTDDCSEEGVLANDNSREILKTVDFVVSDSSANHDTNMENSVRRFEHV